MMTILLEEDFIHYKANNYYNVYNNVATLLYENNISFVQCEFNERNPILSIYEIRLAALPKEVAAKIRKCEASLKWKPFYFLKVTLG